MTREEKEDQAQLEWLRKWKERRKEKRDVRKKSLFYKILRKLGIIKDYEEDIRTRMEMMQMEPMTRARLAAYRNNKLSILSLEYILNNRWQSESMIGNDVVLDYSKGYPIPQSIVGFDQEKYERLQERDLKRKECLEKECEEIERFVEEIEDPQLHNIFRMYYIDGADTVNQAEVAKELHVERSTISKKIDRYLQLSHNSHESHI